MKKKRFLRTIAVVVMVVMLLLLYGCGNSEGNTENDFDLEKFVDANRVSSILSVKNSARLYNSSDYYESGTVYIEKGLEYGEYDSFSYIDLDGTLYYYMPDQDGNLVLYEEWNAMSQEEVEANKYKPDDMFVLDFDSANEKILNVVNNDDGTIDVYTEFSPDYMRDFDLGYEDGEDVQALAHYKVDAETMLLLEGDDSFILDGNEKPFSSNKIVYDDEITPLGAEMLDAVNESIKAKEGKCITFTAIYDAGTDKEEVFTIKVGENNNVDLKARDGYAIYLDKDQKQQVERLLIGGSEDITVYLFPEE